MKKNKFIVILMLILLCFPVSLLNSSNDVYAITPITKDQLPTNKGDAVTGDDIVNVGRYLYGIDSFTYSNIGTCTGFVTRVLAYLNVGKPLVSPTDDWFYCYYSPDLWDDPGYKYTAAWMPSGFKSQADKMVRNGTAEYVGMIPLGSPETAQTLGLQNGDLLVTPEVRDENDKDKILVNGHVAFVVIEDGLAKSMGATGSGGNGITVMEFRHITANKQGDHTYVYRLVKPNGNLKIIKSDEHDKPLANVKFAVSGPAGDFEMITDANGEAYLEGLTAGEYSITETEAPEGLVIDPASKTTTVTIEAGQTLTYTKENKYQRGSTIIHKVDVYEGDNPKGDAVLAGAEYKLYAAEDIYEGATKIYSNGQVVATTLTKENGYTDKIENLPIGKYYWQESKPSEGYNLNDEKIDVVIEYKGADVAEATYSEFTSKEDKYYGRARVIKMDNNSDGVTIKSPAEGAVLKLTLKNDPTQSYEATVDAYGNAEFIDTEFAALHPEETCTIPYGEYELTEVRASNTGVHTYFHINPETIILDVDQETETRLVIDEPVDAFVKVIKTDAVNGKTVALTGAKFKIWDCQKTQFVSQRVYPSGEYTTEFETDSNGIFVTPEKLAPGKYIIYETAAPEGYYLNDDWKLPENEADIGVEGKGGKVVELNKTMVNLPEDAEFDQDLVVIAEVKMPNYPLMAKLQINKTGEMLSDKEVVSTIYGEKYTPVYTLEGLPGVTYNIIAAEDIKSPDGKATYVTKGTVVDTITTDESGTAISKDLHLGEYEIVETVVPLGYLKDTDIENVVLENADKTVAVKTHSIALNNDRQKLKITLDKEYIESEFISEDVENRKSVFGVFTNEDIRGKDGVVILKDCLVDVIEIVGEETDVTSNIDLPAGKYYVLELETTYPYVVSTDKVEFEIKHVNNDQPIITYTGEPIINDYEKGSITLIKLSSSSSEDLTLEGDEVTSELDDKVNQMLEDIKGMTEEELRQYLLDHEIKFVPGATYKVYTDKDCEQPLKQKVNGEYVEIELVTTDSGIIKIEDIPLGKYYLKETIAPEGYELSEEPIVIELTRENKGTMVYRAIIEESIKSHLITKTDIFTGEAIPRCTFEIKDENGKVLLHSITNEEGIGYIAVDIFENGKTYTYTEIDAPEMYKLNKEPHEFVAKFDENGRWITEKIEVENLRKESTVTLEKLDFADSTAIPNCKFELRSLETDFVVEGVTDENGIYVFENIPYGKYTYTELEAPEEYMIDTEPHEITIDAEQVKIQVTNQKLPEAPDTGDIQVVVLAGILVMSVVGIIYVLKNKKQLVK